jgi:hypothetical protein
MAINKIMRRFIWASDESKGVSRVQRALLGKPEDDILKKRS